MKSKILVLITLVLFMVFSNGLKNVSYAEIFYNEETSQYFSTSEDDGTLAFGSSVYNEDGSICGSNKDDRRYLENIVPIPKKELALMIETKAIDIENDFKDGLTVHRINNDTVFMWKTSDENAIPNKKLDFKESGTKNVLARAYNIEFNTVYKTVNINVPLDAEEYRNTFLKTFERKFRRVAITFIYELQNLLELK